MTDTLQPNILTPNPDGSITATLTGYVIAKGVNLPTIDGPVALPAPAGGAVTWSRPNGQKTGQLIAQRLPSGEVEGRFAGSEDGINWASFLIISTRFNSDFIQSATRGIFRVLDTGVAAFNFAGTNNAVATVNHVIGNRPFVVMTSMDGAFLACSATTRTSTQITLTAFTTTGAAYTGAANAFWVALSY